MMRNNITDASDDDRVVETQQRTQLDRHLRCAAHIYAAATSTMASCQVPYKPIEDTALFGLWRHVYAFAAATGMLRSCLATKEDEEAVDKKTKSGDDFLELARKCVSLANAAPTRDSRMTTAPRGTAADSWTPLSSVTVLVYSACYLATLGLMKAGASQHLSVRLELLMLRARALMHAGRWLPLDERSTETALQSALTACAELVGASAAAASASVKQAALPIFRVTIEIALQREVETDNINVASSNVSASVGGAAAAAAASSPLLVTVVTAGYLDIARMMQEAALMYVSLSSSSPTSARNEEQLRKQQRQLAEFKALPQIWAPTPPTPVGWNAAVDANRDDACSAAVIEYFLRHQPPTQFPAGPLREKAALLQQQQLMTKKTGENDEEQKEDDALLCWSVPRGVIDNTATTTTTTTALIAEGRVIHCVRIDPCAEVPLGVTFRDQILVVREAEPCFLATAIAACAASDVAHLSSSCGGYVIGLLEGPATSIGSMTRRRMNPFVAALQKRPSFFSTGLAIGGESAGEENESIILRADVGSVILYRSDGLPVVANEARAIFQFLQEQVPVSAAAGDTCCLDKETWMLMVRENAVQTWQQKTQLAKRLFVRLL